MKETGVYTYINPERSVGLLEARIGFYFSMYSIFFVKWGKEGGLNCGLRIKGVVKERKQVQKNTFYRSWAGIMPSQI